RSSTSRGLGKGTRRRDLEAMNTETDFDTDEDVDEYAPASAIRIHGPEDFEGMRAAGRLAAECLDYLTPMVKPNVLTDDLDRAAYEFITSRGSAPAPLY